MWQYVLSKIMRVVHTYIDVVHEQYSSYLLLFDWQRNERRMQSFTFSLNNTHYSSSSLQLLNLIKQLPKLLGRTMQNRTYSITCSQVHFSKEGSRLTDGTSLWCHSMISKMRVIFSFAPVFGTYFNTVAFDFFFVAFDFLFKCVEETKKRLLMNDNIWQQIY